MDENQRLESESESMLGCVGTLYFEREIAMSVFFFRLHMIYRFDYFFGKIIQ